MKSPYISDDPRTWTAVTEALIKQHPLTPREIKEIVLQSWDDIFESKLGKRGFHIGKDIFPKPQILGFLLHELIPLELERRYPGKWRREIESKDKDIIYTTD